MIKKIAIDLDSQAALTTILLREQVEKSVFDLLTKGNRPEDYIRKVRDNLFLIPSDPKLATFEAMLQKVEIPI